MEPTRREYVEPTLKRQDRIEEVTEGDVMQVTDGRIA
jgi:hypothetical protein